MKSGILSLAGICGVLYPIILIGASLLAVSMAPTFDWNANWLSDLGGQIPPAPDPWIYSIPGLITMPVFDRAYVTTEATAPIFNFGLMLTGFASLIFSIGLRKSLLTPGGRLAALLLIVASIAMILVGIFLETAGIFHSAPAVIVFLFVPTAMCCIGVLMLESNKSLGYLTFLLGIIAFYGITFLMTPLEFAVSIMFGTPIYFRATPEIVNFIAVGIFTIIFGIKMFKGQTPILSKNP
ncbi:MAG: DUF998 domain-containing protein [Candidatus Bathyarchaeota archaeon]|nr:DUF998 domain-containing protein [Candidatus Bathyarchaeota archaeon]